jgi:nucleotide-binding universal stress UspA family protein
MTEIRQILFPTDLSAASDAAFQHARTVAERFDARLTIFHAVEIPWRVFVREGEDHEAELAARWAEKARTAIDQRFASAAAAREVVVRTDVVAPALLVDAALLEFMGQRQPDLVVMATHARTGLDRAFVGSVTEQIVHHGGRPVLCVRPGAAARLPYRRIVVTTDLSAASRRAFPWAASLSEAFGAELTALHAPARSTVAALGGWAPPPAAAPTAEAVRQFLGSETGAGTEVLVTAPGPAWSAIVQAAEERQADLIVMSGQGHDSLGDHILGSTTDRVLRHAPCAVLVIPPS